jgi:hypothetical protein
MRNIKDLRIDAECAIESLLDGFETRDKAMQTKIGNLEKRLKEAKTKPLVENDGYVEEDDLRELDSAALIYLAKNAMSVLYERLEKDKRYFHHELEMLDFAYKNIAESGKRYLKFEYTNDPNNSAYIDFDDWEMSGGSAEYNKNCRKKNG